MIDIHCHILPGVDDGASSLEESLVMARLAVEDGIHTLVATPHTLNGVYFNTANEIRSSVADLQKYLLKNNVDLRLCMGAEVHLCPHILEKIKKGDAATLNSSGKYILLEFPPHTIPPGVKDEIFALKMNGITPIIVHPERNCVIQRHMDILYEFVRMGALIQVTAMSITGDFDEMSMQCAEKLLEHRLIHVIASDAHSADYRIPALSRAVEVAAEILGNDDEAERMVNGIPHAILKGNMPEIPEPVMLPS